MNLIELDTGHLADLLVLTRFAGWNQTAQDWTMMLAAGRGWGIVDTPAGAPPGARDAVIASAVIQPYPPDRAWISMVLVSPTHRRRGLASRLMQVAIDAIENQSLTAWLDATDDGRLVYRKLGFADVFGFTRWQCDDAQSLACAVGANGNSVALRTMHSDHLPRVTALDAMTFGAPRSALIAHLAARAASFSWVAMHGQELTGSVLGRDGDNAWQLGPLVAQDESVAEQLLARALRQCSGPVYCDMPDRHSGLAAKLRAAGFKPQRQFTRMRCGAGASGNLAGPPTGPDAYLLAGPELG